MTKTILTDVDGCLVWWNKSFYSYMDKLGYKKTNDYHLYHDLSKIFDISDEECDYHVGIFNTSEHIANLIPMVGAVENVKKLHNEGFNFVAITSLSDHSDAREYRKQNLDTVFGEGLFDLICLPINSKKDRVLSEWSNTGFLWIEDHPVHAKDGYDLGLTPVLVEHTYNAHFEHPEIIKIHHESAWDRIYEIAQSHYK